MRVTFAVSGNHFGGACQHVYTLVSQLGQAGIRSCIITEAEALIQKTLQMPEQIETIRVNGISQLAVAVRKSVRAGADIVHAHRPGAILAITSAQLGVPIICSIHAQFLPHKWSFEQRVASRVQSLPAMISEHAHRIIAVSEAVRESLVIAGVPRDRVQVIYNGVSSSNRRQPLVTSGPPTIGYVGRLSREKGPDVLVEACRLIGRTSRFRLAIVGDGPLRGEIESQVAEAGLSGVATLYGHLENPYDIMSQMDLLVVPSREEGMGLVVLEAMTMGLPVVGSSVGGIPEAVVHELTGLLVTPDNPEGLALALATLLNNANLRQRLGQEGYVRWDSLFRVEPFIACHIALYRQCSTKTRFESDTDRYASAAAMLQS